MASQAFDTKSVWFWSHNAETPKAAFLLHVDCALAANHTITAADLKKAHKVIREQKKAAQQGSQYQTQQQSQDVVDVD